MEGRLLSFDPISKKGIVDSGSRVYGCLTIYFQQVPPSLIVGSTIHFSTRTSSNGNTYAVFIEVVERNDSLFNTEDKELWYEWGANQEVDFVNKIVPLIKIDVRINPQKSTDPAKIDLYDYTNNRYADLKVQNTPFFMSGRYLYKNVPYDPAYTVPFNHKDYLNYKQHYPNCDIYFWVIWKQTSYRDVTVANIRGVWRARFPDMANAIKSKQVVLHEYIHRRNDDHNAKSSYLFNLNDSTVFERLL